MLRNMYYNENSIQLYQGDCLEVMKQIPDKSVDMVLCDLPYGCTQSKIDIQIPFKPLWEQYERIAKDNAAIVLFAQGLFFVDLVQSNRKMYRYDICWDKILISGFLNAKRMPLRQHEQIAVFYKKQPTYNPQMSIGKPLHGKGHLYKEKDVTNKNYGEYETVDDDRAGSTEKYPTSIIRFQKPHPSKALHQTEKPVALLEYLIKTYSNEGDVVFDNCMGSGSTGVACVDAGRSFIGIELDEKYYKIAENRICEAYKGVIK